jgi:hypothetical protein
MIKRFVWMAGAQYYASGGFHDYRGSFDTMEEAKAMEAKWIEENGKEYNWSHICDTQTGMIEGYGEGCNPMKMFQG